MSTHAQPQIARCRLDYLKREILDSRHPAELRHPSQAQKLYWSGHTIFIVPEAEGGPGYPDTNSRLTFDTPYAEAISWLLVSLCEQFAPKRQETECLEVVSAALLASIEALDMHVERSPRKILAHMLYEIYKLCGLIDVELVEFLGRYDDADFHGSIEDELRSFDPEAPAG